MNHKHYYLNIQLWYVNEIFSTVLNTPIRKKKTQHLYNELYAISLTDNKKDKSTRSFTV